MSVEPQRALQHDPGRFRAFFTFEPLEMSAEGRRNLNIAAATLLKEVESDQLKDKPLNVLVAVSWDQLNDNQRLALEREYAACTENQHSGVLIQVAAETEDERTYARRLIRRVFRGRGKKMLEYYCGRRTLNREAFGYAEVSVTGPQGGAPPVPTSDAAPGVSWLLFQRCVQLVENFYDQSSKDQDALVGRPRTPMPDPANPNAPYPVAGGSHIAIERQINGVPSKLLRRSISYESFDEDGLLFLASAGTATALQDALKGFQDERLQQFVEQHEGGIYVVPPSSSWLLESKEVEAFGARRPPIEEIFYPKFPLVLYEVTPKTLKFFKRVFHAHKDHFDDRGELRADLKLLTKGLAKLLYGAAIPSNSPLFDFLEHAFAPDSSARVVREIESNPRQKAANQMVPGSFVKDLEGLSKARLKHDVARQAAFRHGKAKKEGADEVTKLDKSFDEEVREQRTRLRNQLAQAPLVKKAYGAPEWLDKSGVELLGEMIVNDAETMSGRLPAEKDELETLVDLCEEAAAEARAINDFVGYYMTFVC